MTFQKWLIHATAECTVCGEQWTAYLTTQELASAHARKTGHLVKADLGYAVEYGGKEERP